jgi:SprT protein
MPTYTDEFLQQRAKVIANAFARAYNAKHGFTLDLPVEIRFDLEDRNPKSAGLRKDQHIELNMILYREHPVEFWNSVIPHEVAHLAQCMYEQRKGWRHISHGQAWRTMMASMAQPPVEFHSFDVSKATEHFLKIRTI